MLRKELKKLNKTKFSDISKHVHEAKKALDEAQAKIEIIHSKILVRSEAKLAREYNILI